MFLHSFLAWCKPTPYTQAQAQTQSYSHDCWMNLTNNDKPTKTQSMPNFGMVAVFCWFTYTHTHTAGKFFAIWSHCRRNTNYVIYAVYSAFRESNVVSRLVGILTASLHCDFISRPSENPDKQKSKTQFITNKRPNK